MKKRIFFFQIKLIPHNEAGNKIGLIETHDEMEEADAVVNALEKEIKLEKRNFSDFAILYRTNSQSRSLEDAFRRSGIPYNIVGGFRFYERKEIKDLILKNTQPIRKTEGDDKEKEQSSALGSLGLKPKPAV